MQTVTPLAYTDTRAAWGTPWPVSGSNRTERAADAWKRLLAGHCPGLMKAMPIVWLPVRAGERLPRAWSNG